MNFRYRVDDADIILSAEEHEIVKADFMAGKSPVFLRGGRVALNKSFVRYVKETESPTEEQEKKREEYLALFPEHRTPVSSKLLTGLTGTRMGKGLDPLFAGNSFRKCIICEQEHFIPTQNEGKCLRCKNNQTQNAKR